MAMIKPCLVLCMIMLLTISCKNEGNFSLSVSGSMAQMILDADTLYYFASGELQIFDLADPSRPQFFGRMILNEWRDRESNFDTISLYEDLLLVGMDDSIMILDSSDKTCMPTHVATFMHEIARDPVIGHGGYLYSTIRSERGGSLNRDRLTVYRINRIESTGSVHVAEVSRKSFFNPHGLSFYNDILLIADGSTGIKGFELSRGIPVQKVFWEGAIDAYDLLPVDGEIFISSTNKILRGTIEDSTLRISGELPVAGKEYVDGLDLITNMRFRIDRSRERIFSFAKKWGIVIAVFIGIVIFTSFSLFILALPFILLIFLGIQIKKRNDRKQGNV